MPEPEKQPGNSERAEEKEQPPTETDTHGMERAPHGVERPSSLSEDIRAHTNRPHKGDVGRPETNEEVYQGSKTKELP